jgi:hypothetical protein
MEIQNTPHSVSPDCSESDNAILIYLAELEAEFEAMQEANALHQAQQAAYDDAQWGL